MAENIGSRVVRPSVFVTDEQLQEVLVEVGAQLGALRTELAEERERINVLGVGTVNLIESVLELQDAVFEDGNEFADEDEDREPEADDESEEAAEHEEDEEPSPEALVEALAEARDAEEQMEEFAAANEPIVPEALDAVEAANSTSGIPEEGITIDKGRDDDDIS